MRGSRSSTRWTRLSLALLPLWRSVLRLALRQTSSVPASGGAPPAERDSGCSKTAPDMTDESSESVVKHLEWLKAMGVMWFDAPFEDGPGQCQTVVQLPLAIQQKILGLLDVRCPAHCCFCSHTTVRVFWRES